MKNPLEFFFSIGTKITKNDPIKKADWDYNMMWVMFIAFFSIGVGYIFQFLKEPRLYYLGWSFVMGAILWFQYFGLKQLYDFRKMLKSSKKPEKVETINEMLEGFKDGLSKQA